ncbi:MAG: hypothetical protein NWF04_05655 [Candidatus Bathyarchaeota archaeon]|nr:hypothetical protein [Candidatus Bathyarchaeota archaeon]
MFVHVCVLFFVAGLLFTCVPNANATPAASWVTISSTYPNDSPIYLPAGKNNTFSFEALWSYGANAGQAIENASLSIQVTNSQDTVVNTLSLNVSRGLCFFNYSCLDAQVLTFTPTKLVTSDGAEWTGELLDAGENLFGLQAQPMVVWWDTFEVSLVDCSTAALGETEVYVNVTHMLLPPEGLTLPAWATYNNQTFLPKAAQNATVTINGVKAQTTSNAGVYTANVSNMLFTAYVHVEVSQEDWVTNHTGFSFTHNANAPLWLFAGAAGLVGFVALLFLHFLSQRRVTGGFSFGRKDFSFLGGLLLAAASVVSLYWGLVGIEGVLHGFDWLLLCSGIASFGLGLMGSFYAVKKKNQAFAILVTVAPLLTNIVFVQISLSSYNLALSWGIMILGFAVAFFSGLLLSNADTQFSQAR